MLDLAIIIPCYNEENSISDTLSRLYGQLTQMDCRYRVFLYNNLSTDNTVKSALSWMAFNGDMDTFEIRQCYRQGKGYAVKQAFSEISAHAYCIIDGDDTYDTKEIPKMYELVRAKQIDMVTGNRLKEYLAVNKRKFHNFGNLFMTKAINLLFGKNYSDVLSGLRMFSYRYVKTFPITGGGFTLETEMSVFAAAEDFSTEEVDIEYNDRKPGDNSKLNTISDGIKVIVKMVDLAQLYRPMLIYGGCGIICFLLSLIFVIPVLSEYFKTGMVLRFPTLIVCGFIMIAGLFMFAIGVIQRGNKSRHRQIIELKKIERLTDEAKE